MPLRRQQQQALQADHSQDIKEFSEHDGGKMDKILLQKNVDYI